MGKVDVLVRRKTGVKDRAAARAIDAVFDGAYYLRTNPDVADSGADPFAHFMDVGWAEGRNPCALFGVDWYLETNPEVAAEGMNPLAHYVTAGAAEGRRPHPLFDVEHYLSQNPDVSEAGVNPLYHYLTDGWREGRSVNPLFDGAWYAKTNGLGADVDPLSHYSERGGPEGLNPHPLFDARGYLERYPDVASSGTDPLVHYLDRGALERRQPHAMFDAAWYLDENPDVERAGANPLVHYLNIGWKEGRDPHPEFDGAWYLSVNKDVPAGIDPLTHYLQVGANEGRNTVPPRDSVKPAPRVVTEKDEKAAVRENPGYAVLRSEALQSGLWDEQWYLANYYRDYRESKRRRPKSEPFFPIDFYLQEGWRLGHDPSAKFPIDINQDQVGCSKLEYFLNHLRFDGYQFDENVWIPNESDIDRYLKGRPARQTEGVVYTCLLNSYDALMQPYYIKPEWDYVCYTDDPELIEAGQVGVWEVRPVAYTAETPTRTNRWHKMHPHLLFPERQKSLYVDANINIISSYIFDQIETRGLPFLLPEHFFRNCIYQEIRTLDASSRIGADDKAQLEELRAFLREEQYPDDYGLSENNLIYREHHDELIVRLMEKWWAIFRKYSARDQASLVYVLWKEDLSIRPHLIANCRINYKDFWVVKHEMFDAKRGALKSFALKPAFDHNNKAVVFSTNEYFIPYLGVAVFSLIANASPEANYDIIILANGIPEAAFDKVLDLAEGRGNVSIRLYDTETLINSLPKSLFHVEGYVPVETYNKCFITEILSGYDRCVYLDSDILVVDDVQELHDIDLQGCAIGASVNVANVNAAYCKKTIKGRRFDDYLKNELLVVDQNKYFQAGVVVLDMGRLGEMDLPSRATEALKRIKKPVFFDQCIYNHLFYGDVAFFSTRWNHVWYMQQYSYLRGSIPDEVFFDYARGRVQPGIIHYAGASKPQSVIGWKLSDRFWDYAVRSPFYDEILEKVAGEENEVSTVIRRGDDESWQTVRPRLLIHLHLFYHDQLDLMLEALSRISGVEADLFVTMTERNPNAEAEIRRAWNDAKFLETPNVGYDVFPFLHVLQQVRISDYEFVLKLHTKNARAPGQDTVYGVSIPGYKWRDDLLAALLGSAQGFEEVLAAFRDDPELGCVGAGQYIFDTRENNEERNYSLGEWRARCGATQGVHYVGGSMFMARAFPFERIAGLNLKRGDFEAAQFTTKDHKNTAHIVERLFGIVVENEGLRIQGR